MKTVCKRQILKALEGDELVSRLDRNSEDRSSALASRHDTSRECCHSTGPSDKWPVLAQRGRTTSQQGALRSTENVLPGSGFSARTPDVQLERYPVGELSLSAETECLSLPPDCSTDVQAKQARGFPSADAVLSSGYRRPPCEDMRRASRTEF